VEIAPGTGLLTPLIAEVWPEVAAVDLSGGMLARSAACCRLQADAARLPLTGGCAALVGNGDGPLFAADAARVTAAGACRCGATRSGRVPRSSSPPKSRPRR